MLVSIVMPMKNAEPYVVQALESVLRNDAFPIEIVVVDDGSTDRSRERVASVGDARIRLVDGPRNGIAESLNTGFAAAKGDIVMRCDADDLFPSDRVARQVGWLLAHPEHDAVCGGFSTMDTRGRHVAQLAIDGDADCDIHEELRTGVTRTSLCTFAITRRALDRVGRFRGYFETSEDIDFLLRLGEACRVGYVPHNTYHYRLHQTSITHSQGGERRAFFDKMARSFQQQRIAAGSDDLDKGCPPAPPDESGASGPSAARHVQGMLLGSAWRSFDAGERLQAVKLAARATWSRPQAIDAWRTLALLVLRSATRPRRSAPPPSSLK